MSTKSTHKLEGRVALVTAASRGLGRASALALSAEGAHVVMMARSKDTLEQASSEIAACTKNRPSVCVGDVRDKADLERAVAETIHAYGTLDIVIANSGGPKAGHFLQLNEDDWT